MPSKTLAVSDTGQCEQTTNSIEGRLFVGLLSIRRAHSRHFAGQSTSSEGQVHTRTGLSRNTNSPGRSSQDLCTRHRPLTNSQGCDSVVTHFGGGGRSRSFDDTRVTEARVSHMDSKGLGLTFRIERKHKGCASCSESLSIGKEEPTPQKISTISIGMGS